MKKTYVKPALAKREKLAAVAAVIMVAGSDIKGT